MGWYALNVGSLILAVFFGAVFFMLVNDLFWLKWFFILLALCIFPLSLSVFLFMWLVWAWLCLFYPNSNSKLSLSLLLLTVSSVCMMWVNSTAILWIFVELQVFSIIVLNLFNKKLKTKVVEAIFSYIVMSMMAGTMLLAYQSYSMSLLNMENTTSFSRKLIESTSVHMILLMFILKLGGSPLSFWVPEVMGGLSWRGLASFSIFPKITFLALLYKMVPENKLLTWTGVMSILLGSMGSLNQSCFKKLLAWGSIYNMGFMFLSLYYKECINYSFLLYVISYFTGFTVLILLVKKKQQNSMMDLSNKINSNKMESIILMMVMMSFLGLPPLGGFLAKSVVIFNALSQASLMVLVALIFSVIMSSVVYLSVLSMSFSNGKSSLKFFSGVYGVSVSKFIVVYITVTISVVFLNIGSLAPILEILI